MKTPKTLTQYHRLADLFYYPTTDFAAKVMHAQQCLEGTYPEHADTLRPFTEHVSNNSLLDMEELFTRTFEVQSVTTLDIGYVMFGDDYKRGELLVNLNREHTKVKNPCGHELSDHLPNVLNLLPQLEDKVLLADLMAQLIEPALRKMIKEFDPKNEKSKNTVYLKHHKTIIDKPKNYLIYEAPLRALYNIIMEDFEIELKEPKKQSVDFLSSIDSEIEIEQLN